MMGFKKYAIYLTVLIMIAGVVGWFSLKDKNLFQLQSNQQIRIKGEVVCLPKKGKGPHTLECAFGFKSLDGKYYGLLSSNNSLLTQNGEKVVIEGIFEKADPNTSYDIVGNIRVNSVLK